MTQKELLVGSAVVTANFSNYANEMLMHLIAEHAE
jgi:hypothetical protein